MRTKFKPDIHKKRFAAYAKKTALIVLILTILAAFSSVSSISLAASNECEDYARQQGIDEQAVPILAWLCLDGVMDGLEQEFIELLAKLSFNLQFDLASKLALDGQISEGDLAQIRAIFNAPINGFETQEEIAAWRSEGGAVLQELSRLHATEGRCSSKIVFASGEDVFPGIVLDSEALKVIDWSSYYAVGCVTEFHPLIFDVRA
jgi:hypothetical protein